MHRLSSGNSPLIFITSVNRVYEATEKYWIGISFGGISDYGVSFLAGKAVCGYYFIFIFFNQIAGKQHYFL